MGFDNEYLDLAIKAGLFPGMGPQSQAQPQPQGDPSLITQPSQLPDSPADGPVTQPEASDAGNIAPQEAAPSPLSLNPGDMVKKGASVGVSQSYSGFSPTKARQVDSRDAGLNAMNAATDAKAAQSGAESQAILDAAAAHEKEAAQHVANATVNKIIAEGHQADLMKGLQESFKNDEAAGELKAQAMSQQGMANYMAALADFRASRVDPAQLWGNMNGATKIGTLASVFVHDFLGVKGMHTSAMDTLNTAIDRNINAQLEAIKVKGEVAEGFKSLWYMQRNQSSSDAEARVRMRGLMLESAKQQVISNLAPYDAGLATAQGQASIAAIDGAQAKNTVELKKHIDAQATAYRSQNTQWAEAKLRAANESVMAGLKAQELDLQRQALNAKLAKQPPQAGDIIYDPETNQGRWIFRNGISDTEKAKVRNQMANVAQFNSAMAELRALDRKLAGGIFDPIKGTRFSDEDERLYSSIQYRLAHAAVKANDERATEPDVQQYLKSFPRETWATNGGVQRILADMNAKGIEPAYYAVQQVADDVPTGLETPGPKNRPFAGTYADATSVASGQDKEKTTGQINRERDEGKLYGPQGGDIVDEPAGYTRKAHEEFIKKYPDAAVAEDKEYLTKGGITEAENSLAHLGITANETEDRGGQQVLTADAVMARKQLQRQADAYTKNDFPSNEIDWRGAFAAMILATDVDHNLQAPPAPNTGPQVPTDFYTPPKFGK